MSTSLRPEPVPADLAPELAEALPAFEAFFKTFGFKRIHGRVWGLLVLYGKPLSNRDICHLLSISVGAASTTLKELEEWGALTTEFDSGRRCHLHAPVGNALSIVATVFRRREQVAFQNFRQAAQRAVEYIQRQHGERDARVLTLRSIIAACSLADAMMNVVFSAVTNALGDSESVLSRALTSALKAGVGGPARLLFRATTPPRPKSPVRPEDRQKAHA
jgi:DNA-binding transcriptional regulator GbsR (MarR family)